MYTRFVILKVKSAFLCFCYNLELLQGCSLHKIKIAFTGIKQAQQAQNCPTKLVVWLLAAQSRLPRPSLFLA